MRLTLPLWRQHIGKMIKRHWISSGKREVIDTGAEYYLNKFNIVCQDANAFVKEKKEKIPLYVIGQEDRPKPKDATHPDYKDIVCHTMSENNVLLEGFQQALVLTKSVHISDTLPESIEEMAKQKSPQNIHNLVKKAIMTANVFDCEQKKLPKIKDPNRPGVNFPRIYGITDVRKTFLTSNILLSILERNSHDVSTNRYISNDANIVSAFKKDHNLIQIQSTANTFVTSDKPLNPINLDTSSTEGIDLPNLHPLTYTVSMKKENFYDFKNVYPFDVTSIRSYYPHTSFLHYNSTKTFNLYEKPVLETQIHGRGLVHAFTVASAFAKTIYEENIKKLPTPITVQCVQSDGKTFYFAVFQLNTLDLDGMEGIKNMWYALPAMKMFESCSYVNGRPSLSNYNENVIHYLNAFYNNS